MSKLKTFLLFVAVALLLLACNIESYVKTPTPPNLPALVITRPPPTLTPIPTTAGG